MKRQKQKLLITSAVSIMALGLANFSFAQSVGGVIKGVPVQQPQSQYNASGSVNAQPINQNTQLLLQLQSLRAELASLRNQVEQQGYQLRQLQQSSGNAGSGNTSISSIEQNNVDQSVVNPSINTQPTVNQTFGNGEILPEQSSVGSNSLPNTTAGQSALQFPLLPQDQPVDLNNSNNSQALPQLVPSSPAQSQQYVQGGRAASPQSQQPLSREAQLLEDGDKLKGVRTNLGELELYNKGIDKLSGQDYKAAASIFSSQLQNFPRGEKAGDGYFWLGETFFIQDDLDSAAKSYQTLVDLFPNHLRTPKALLKLVSVHQARQDQDSAKIAFNALVSKYSGSTEAESARSQFSSLL